MTTFYDNINEYFEKNINIKDIIKDQNIYDLQSQIIKEYDDVLEGEGIDEYFEDKVLNVFNEYVDRHDNAEEYDDICNNIIFIYYNSILRLKEYYSAIFRKERFYLENHL